MSLNEKIKIGALAAWKAGNEILDVYETDFDVMFKTDTSPVTQADQRADKIIRDTLQEIQIPIISEETKQVDYYNRKKWNSFWLVDPLDGTKEFIQKNGEFTVNIAYIEANKPLYGILYVPVTKHMYIADVTQQFVYFLEVTNEMTESDFTTLEQKVQKISKPDNSEFNTLLVSRSHLDMKTTSIITQFSQAGIEINKVGSALKYAKLITGESQLYFRFSPTMEWDNAAGHALCLASGLSMCQLPSKSNINYNTRELYSPYFAAGTKQALDSLFELL